MNQDTHLPIISQSKTPVDFKVRQVKFDFNKELPKYWVNNDPFRTFFMTAMGIMFTPGETLVVEGVRNYRHSEKITDPKLKKEVSAFIGQEGFHSREHDRLNEILMHRNFKVLPYIMKFMQAAVGLMIKVFPKRFLVAISAATEHLTAIFGNHAMKHRNVDEIMSMIPPEMKELWVWHALEEMEHKSVCFDVEVAVSNSYWLRSFSLVFITLIALSVIFSMQLYMIVADGLLFRGDLWKTEFHHLWNRKNGFLGSVIKQWFGFFRRDFHPWDNMEDLEFIKQMDAPNYDPVKAFEATRAATANA